ncbi:MAG: BPTI/Kunitz domain-containing protein [Thiothrix litoralis]
MKNLLITALLSLLFIFSFTNQATANGNENIKPNLNLKIEANSNLKPILLNGNGKDYPHVVYKSCEVNPAQFNMAKCKARFIRYYFNSISQSCEEIIWGGCPSEPPFKTMQQCQRYCESTPTKTRK